MLTTARRAKTPNPVARSSPGGAFSRSYARSLNVRASFFADWVDFLFGLRPLLNECIPHGKDDILSRLLLSIGAVLLASLPVKKLNSLQPKKELAFWKLIRTDRSYLHQAATL